MENGNIQLRGDIRTADKRLDRLVEFDERSRQYPVRKIVTAKNPRSYTWKAGKVLDQGQDGACVGFAWSGLIETTPNASPNIDNTFAENLYHLAQKLDQYPGENYEGSSTLGGAKAALQMGYITGYHWAFTLEEIVLGIGYHSPLVMGIDWYESMFTPNTDNFIIPSGLIKGGHDIEAHAVKCVKVDTSKPLTFDNLDLNKSYITLRNSWGQWAKGGDVYVRLIDVKNVLMRNGDFCLPIGKKVIK